jgi:class I fructose-bisphosphate aldolase
MKDQSCGKLTRLGRIFDHQSGRALVVALDHGLVGNLPGIEDLPSTLDKVVQAQPNAVVVSAGAMSRLSPTIRGQCGIILTIDTFLSSSIPRSDAMGEAHRLLASAEEALALGADAVKVFLIGGQEDLDAFADNVVRVGQTAQMCNRWGLPLIVEPTLWGSKVAREQKNDPELVKHMCRIALESGADVLKIPNPGPEVVTQLVNDTPCPILIMGGSKVDSEELMIEGVREAIEAGADGIVYGQNVWQRDDPAALIKKLSRIIHSK